MMKKQSQMQNDLRRLGKWATALMLVVAALLVAAELVLGRKPDIETEGLPLFPAIFGFIVFVVIVFGGAALRKIVMRKEDYYDR